MSDAPSKKPKAAPDAGGVEVAGEAPPRRGSPARAFLGLFVVGLLLAIAIPNFRAARRRDGPRVCPANLKLLGGAAEMWLLDHGDARRADLLANPRELLVEAGYLQRWPRCNRGPDVPYSLRPRPDGRGVEPVCGSHGTLAQAIGR